MSHLKAALRTKSQRSHGKLAQTYPSSFLQETAHILLRFLKEVFLLDNIFEPFITKSRSELDKIAEEYNMTSASLCIPHAPYNKCIMYNRTIGSDLPLTAPPGDACVVLWQANANFGSYRHTDDWIDYSGTC